jgi:hypothetical protein
MGKTKVEIKCFFCKEPIVGTQHGVWPFVDDPNDPRYRCCEECNKKEVTTAIKSMARVFKGY